MTARITGPRPLLDQRRFIASSAITEIALAGSIASARYTVPLAMTCTVARAAVRGAGNADAVAASELLWGEVFDVFDIAEDWAFGRSVHDDYIGWVPIASLSSVVGGAKRTVTARSAPLFVRPDIKSPALAELPFGARVEGPTEGRFVAVPGGGFVHLRHVESLAETPLAVAWRFIGAPYLWGGRSPFGVDCSGLVQAALMACGTTCPRDSDQQRGELGTAVDFAERRCGDLVFFPGHVGMLVDAETLLHANAYWMAVTAEPLADVIARLDDGAVTAVRRI